MISPRNAAGIVLALSLTTVAVILGQSAYGMLIWLGWLGR